jgi:uncharacterized protein with von Willebrand factor type A (vWA) domain
MNTTAQVSHAFLHEILLMLLYNLRERDFELGPSDFLLAIKALQQDIGTGSRDDFVFLCQSLWGKSPDQQEEIEKVLEVIWQKHAAKERLSGNETDKPKPEPKQDIKKNQAQPGQPGRKVDKHKPGDPPASKKTPDKTMPEKTDSTLTQLSPPSTDIKIDFRFGASKPDAQVTIPEIQTLKVNPTLDLEGSLPIRIRHMKRSWRYYRKMKRTGPPVELDMRSTIQQISRHGFLFRPTLRPRRVNQAGLLVLVDQGGSMVPFGRVVEALLDSAKHSGLGSVSTFYFHDVPRKKIFSDPELINSQMLDQVLRDNMGRSILIISDAGAARRNYDENRLDHTVHFIKLLKRVTKNIAWLNPTPEERWQHTTAGAITREAQVPMFTMTRDSLNDAIDVLRGKID